MFSVSVVGAIVVGVRVAVVCCCSCCCYRLSSIALSIVAMYVVPVVSLASCGCCCCYSSIFFVSTYVIAIVLCVFEVFGCATNIATVGLPLSLALSIHHLGRRCGTTHCLSIPMLREPPRTFATPSRNSRKLETENV